MDKRLGRALALSVLAGLALAVFGSVPATARDKQICNGAMTGKINGGLLVPSGDSCTLTDATVNGGMDVEGGQINIHNSVINGGLFINNLFGNNPVCSTELDGGVTVTNITTGAVLAIGESNNFFGGSCPGGTINGDTDVVNNPMGGNLEIDGYLIHGHLQWINSTSYGELEGDTVKGGATCQNSFFVINDGDGGPNSYTGPNNGCPA